MQHVSKSVFSWVIRPTTRDISGFSSPCHTVFEIHPCSSNFRLLLQACNLIDRLRHPRSLRSSPSIPIPGLEALPASPFLLYRLHRQSENPVLVHPLAHLFCHFFHSFFSFARCRKNTIVQPSVTSARVPSMLTNTLRKVVVLTVQPNPLALSSNRSAPNGHICGLTSGESSGRV